MCLRCFNPLPQSTGFETVRKPVRREALDRVIAERKPKNILIATATPRPHHQKIIATATPPPRHKNVAEYHDDTSLTSTTPMQENSNVSTTETSVTDDSVKSEETLKISPGTMGLLQQLKELNEISEIPDSKLTPSKNSFSETSTSSKLQPSAVESTEVLSEDEKFKRELNKLKDDITKLEPDQTIEKINPHFGAIRVDELQKYFAIIDSLENAEVLYAQTKEKLSFNRGYVLESGYITQLSFSEIGLSVIPGYLSSLQKLSALDLERNMFEDFPDGLDRLPNLESLNVSECGMKIIPSSVSKLVSLKSLWLYDNELTELPAKLNSLENLELLDLRGNKLGTSEINQIYDLKKLKFLSLESNDLKSISERIDELTELETLLIGDNPIEDFPDISNLKNLKELSLYDTKLKYVPESILFLPNLQKLDLWNTGIKPHDWILQELKEAGVDIKISN